MRRLLRAAGWMCLCGAAALLAAWLTARSVSDRWLYTQYLVWTPPWWVLLGAAGLSLGSLLLRLPPRPGVRPVRSRAAAAIAVGACVAAAAWQGFVEERWHRAGFPITPIARTIRVAHWNACDEASIGYNGSFAGLTGARNPDVLVLTTLQREDVLNESIATLGEGYTVARFWSFVCVSRFPCTAKGTHSLNIDAKAAGGIEAVEGAQAGWVRSWLARIFNRWARGVGASQRSFRQDTAGFIIWFRLDTTAVLGRPIVVWLIDLPSDPLMFRWLEAAQVRSRLDDLMGQKDAATGDPVLPPADVILGDFNIPRGSASLRRIVGPGFTHAYDQGGGWGPMLTWPRVSPLLAIDNMFIGKGLRCVGYEVHTPAITDHRVQAADIARD